MDARLYLAIAAVVAIVYAIAFLLLPVQASLLLSGFAEPRAVLNLRFCGAAVSAWGLISLVRAGFSGLGGGAKRSNCQRCWPPGQHHHKCMGDFGWLA